MSASLRAATYAGTLPLRLAPKFAKCVRVYDGDTVWLAFEHAGKIIRSSARLMGVDTPEVRTKCSVEKTAGLAARDDLRKLILDKVVRVRVDDKNTDKYGRLLVWIWREEGALDQEFSVNKYMMMRWGVEYNGGTKQEMDWSIVPRPGAVAGFA